jgi:UDP-GlcNAc:undecaprenyl-phosphate/decaprenyl-phosphate GlcNAc-1-phosphate transferase
VSAAPFVAVGFALGVPLMWAALLIGRRLGLLDLPTGIKVHRLPVPYTGGAAIAATLAVAWVVFDLPPAVLLGGLFIWVVGLVDDIRSLPPTVKLVLEIPPLIIGASTLGLEPLAITAAALVGAFLVNCFNVIDGLDGLAGGVAVISMLAILWATGSTVGAIAGLLVGALAAFLLFNLHPARLFLGDQGSLLLGYFLWILPLASAANQPDARDVIFGVLLWVFPLVNAAFVVSKRLIEGRALLAGDRGHLYDVLHRRIGLRRTLLACWSVAALSSIAATAVIQL